ncbi:unnamed protein product [Prunus brigantina]
MQSKVTFKQQDKENMSTGVLDYIHSNVWGPALVKSLGGARYYVGFLDDFSRKVWVYSMKEKYESEGVKRHFTVKKTPQKNGAVKRLNRTLMECERCMRIHAGLPKAFWAEAVNHASSLVNRSSSNVYALIPSDERTKLKPKSLECIFLNFESGVKGFKLRDPMNRKKILSRDVVFDEKTMPMIKVKKPEAKEDVVGTKTTITISPSRVFGDSPSMQSIENVHKVVESDTEEAVESSERES